MRILAVFAHPDDESYGPAGTLARATRDGHTVALLTLTRGESASMGLSKKLSAKDLSQRRSEELKSAAEKIGIQQVNLLNLADKNLQYIPDQKGRKIILNEIETFNPDIVITFHENTISGHPDHLAVTKWVMSAVKSINDPPRVLLFGLDRTQTTKADFEKFFAIEENEITHRINVEDCLDIKEKAIRCHKTQLAMWQKFMKYGVDVNDLFRWEVFVQKWPAPEKNTLKHDLFE